MALFWGFFFVFEASSFNFPCLRKSKNQTLFIGGFRGLGIKNSNCFEFWPFCGFAMLCWGLAVHWTGLADWQDTGQDRWCKDRNGALKRLVVLCRGLAVHRTGLAVLYTGLGVLYRGWRGTGKDWRCTGLDWRCIAEDSCCTAFGHMGGTLSAIRIVHWSLYMREGSIVQRPPWAAAHQILASYAF